MFKDWIKSDRLIKKHKTDPPVNSPFEKKGRGGMFLDYFKLLNPS